MILLLWLCLGSFASGNEWQAIGPETAYPISIVFHPGNPLRVYAGMDDGGGVWISDDGGIRWRLPKEPFPGVSGWALAVNPENGNILYGGDFYGRGVYRSLDSGENWQFINEGLTNLEIRSLAFGVRGDRIYVGTKDGVFTQSPSDQVWRRAGLAGESIPTLVSGFRGRRPPLYAGTTKGVLYESRDRGDTWIPLYRDMEGRAITSLVIDRRERLIGLGLDGGLVARSEDSGRNWELAGENTLHSTWWVRLAMSPHDSNVWLAGTTGGGIYRSEDGGKNWVLASAAFPGNHVCSVAFSESVRNFALAGAYGAGIYRTANGGLSWSETSSGLRNAYVSAIAFGSDGSMLLGCGDAYPGNRELFLSRDAGQTFSWVRGIRQDVECLHVSRADPRKILAGTQEGGIFRSVDRGQSWTYTGLSGRRVNFIREDPLNPERLFAGTGRPEPVRNGLYVSPDGGLRWEETPLSRLAVFDLVFNATNPRHVVAGGPGLFQSHDGGNSWVRSGLQGLLVAALAQSENNPDIWYAAATAGATEALVLRSSDALKTWEVVYQAGATFLTGLIVNPRDSDHVLVGGMAPDHYAVSHTGCLFETRDGGRSWTDAAPSPAPTRNVWALELNPFSKQVIYVGTYGGGAFRRRLNP